MMMRNKNDRSLIVGIVMAAMFFLAPAAARGEKKTFALKEDLAIGVESGDENLMFGSVADIGLDAAGNILILDWKNSRIQKFDGRGKFLKSVALKQGQGPGEVAMLGGMAVSPAGTIAVLDQGSNTILIFNPEGEFRRFFKPEFRVSDLGFLEEDQIVALGLHKEKIIHLFDPEGRLLSSFGEPFEIPSHLSKYKDMPLMKYPMRFSCSRRGNIFLTHPHRFEIFVYRDSGLVRKFAGKSDLFRPMFIPNADARGMSLVFPFVTILESGNRLYVTVWSPGRKGSNELTVYEDDRPIGTLAIDGMPRAVDSEGRIYCSEETDWPRLVRYIFGEK